MKMEIFKNISSAGSFTNEHFPVKTIIMKFGLIEISVQMTKETGVYFNYIEKYIH